MPTALGVLALLLSVLLGVVAPGVAGAQASGPGPEPTIRLAQQTPWVGPDGTYQVAVRVDGLPGGAEVQGFLYNRVRSRSALDQVLDDGPTGDWIFATPRRPAAEASPSGDGTLVVTMPVAAGRSTEPEVAQLDPTPGVYPFVVRVYAGGREIGSLTTTLLRLGPTELEATSGPLMVGTVVPLRASVTPGPDGAPTLDEGAAAPLEALAAVVDDHPEVPLTLDPSAESLALLDALGSDGRAVVDSLRTKVNRQVLAGPYAPLDSGAWIEAGLDAEMDDQRTAGTAELLALLGTRPDASTTVLDPTVSPAALAHLADGEVTSAVVPSGQLEPLGDGRDDTFSQQFTLLAADTSVQAVVGDDAAARRLLASDDPVLAGHRALAELAVRSVSDSGSARGVGVVVPTGADPVALSTFLAGLADTHGTAAGTPGAAMVGPVTLTDLFATTSVAVATRNGRTTSLERGYRADPPADLGAYPASLRATRARLDGMRSLVPSAPALTGPVTTTILSSGSRALDGDERQSMLAAADETVTATTDEIVVAPEQVVTLTSSSGNIPLNLENRLQVPAHVRIVLSSAKLDFPEGAVIEQDLAPAQTTTIELPVETRASGAFPLDVAITSADGTLSVATSTYTVRSTAISGVGLVLSVGAGLFLLLWWGRHWRTARRARQLVASTHPALSATGPDGYAPADTDAPASDPRSSDPGPPPDPAPSALDPDPLEGR